MKNLEVGARLDCATAERTHPPQILRYGSE